MNFDLYDLAVNNDGTLRMIATFTDGDFTGGKTGTCITLQHKQKKFLMEGGENTLWLQYAQGSAGLNGNYGRLDAGSGSKGMRLIESYAFQSGRLGGQGQIMFQNDKDPVTGKTDSATVGGRLSYAVTNNFKMVGELGYSQKKPDGAPTQKLTKFTIAPTISTGPTFWSRPGLRLYLTHAKWNAEANAAAGLGGVTGAGDNRTSGTSYGVQVEVWW